MRTMTAMCAWLLAAAAVAQMPAMPPPPGMGPPPPGAEGPPLELALRAAQVALEACTRQGYVIGVSVVDSAGIQKVVLGADRAAALAMTSSLRKAATATALGMPTSQAAEKAKTDADFAARAKADEKLLLIPGGVPIIVKGKVMGGIGAGGGPSQIEEQCAQRGVDAIVDKL